MKCIPASDASTPGMSAEVRTFTGFFFAFIRFGSEAEKRQIENLQKLLALGVEFPWLVPLIRRLISMPSNQLFWLAYKLWKGWAIKNRMFPFRMTFKEYLESALYYMRIKSQ